MNAHNEQQSIIAGALFDLMGYLKCREKKLHLSASDDAAPAVEALTEWAEERGFDLDKARVTDWQAALAAQPSPVVKQNLTTAAAQEAVLRIYAEGDMRVVTEWLDGSRDLPDGDHRLYAAPVTAAPVLYGVPDGKGGVKLGKGWAFSKEPDRALGTTQPLFTEAPAAPGIDLKAFREPVAFWFEHLVNHPYTETNAARLREAKRLLALIDASPKGTTFPNDENSEAQFIGDGERLNCQVFGGSGHVEDSPKGGSEARDAARYRWLREFAVNGSIGIPFHGWLNCDEPASEWDSAIDAAMQAGDAEVQP